MQQMMSSDTHEYLRIFILKMLEYMQEEILKHEITGIETLEMLKKPEDLKRGWNDMPRSNNTRAGPVAGSPLNNMMR